MNPTPFPDLAGVGVCAVSAAPAAARKSLDLPAVIAACALTGVAGLRYWRAASSALLYAQRLAALRRNLQLPVFRPQRKEPPR